MCEFTKPRLILPDAIVNQQTRVELSKEGIEGQDPLVVQLHLLFFVYFVFLTALNCIFLL